MHDHNLDDLIIDNLEPKNTKAKSFLTIIALLIIVLIVAIILTKIILKDSNADRLALEEDLSNHISPELTLQNVSQEEEPKAPTSTLNVKKSIKKIVPDSVLAPLTKHDKPEKIAQRTVTVNKESSYKKQQKSKPKVTKPKVIKPKVTKPKVTKASHTKPVHSNKPVKPTNKPQVSTEPLFIQVGSFSKEPSSRFLSVVTNAGFKYKITAASSTGVKKLLIGPYADRASADTDLVKVRSRINKSAFIIKKP